MGRTAPSPVLRRRRYDSQQDELDRLRAAYADGRLDLETFEARVERALREEPLPDPSNVETR